MVALLRRSTRARVNRLRRENATDVLTCYSLGERLFVYAIYGPPNRRKQFVRAHLPRLLQVITLCHIARIVLSYTPIAITQEFRCLLPLVQALARSPLNCWKVCRQGLGLAWGMVREGTAAPIQTWTAAITAWLGPGWAVRVPLACLLLWLTLCPVSASAGILTALLTTTTIAECRTGGSDTLNGGFFDPSKVSAGGFTDGAATLATSNAPVFTSASYTFLSPGDVGAWLYIDSGTNWTPGWYQIASVSAGAATLTATLGAGVLAGNQSMTTVAGCATTASPTGAKWTIDYSQQNAAQFAYLDLASAGTGLTVSSSAKPFAKQQVGNALVITGGTNFNTGRYVIASISGVTATVVGPTNITTGAGASGTGGLGGAFLSPGLASSLFGTTTTAPIFLKNDGSVFSITSASAGVSAGTLTTNGVALVGYSTNRTFTNTDTRPTLQLNVSTATMFTSQEVVNVILDGNTQTAALLTGTVSGYERCLIKNFNTAVTAFCFYRRCYATTNSAAVFNGSCFGCEASANTATVFVAASNGGLLARCLSHDNTVSTTDGFGQGASFAYVADSIAYANGRDGVRSGSARGCACENVICESNTGVGFSKQGTWLFLKNCATYLNTGGPTSGSPNLEGMITLTASAFTKAASGDFSLNAAAGGGALLRSTGSLGLFPLGLTTGYGDIGAAQHPNPNRDGFQHLEQGISA